MLNRLKSILKPRRPLKPLVERQRDSIPFILETISSINERLSALEAAPIRTSYDGDHEKLVEIVGRVSELEISGAAIKEKLCANENWMELTEDVVFDGVSKRLTTVEQIVGKLELERIDRKPTIKTITKNLRKKARKR